MWLAFCSQVDAPPNDASGIWGGVVLLLRSVWVPLLPCAEIGFLGCAGVGCGAPGRAPGRAGSRRGQGRFDFKPSFWGPSQLNLSPGPNFVSSVVFSKEAHFMSQIPVLRGP